MLVFHLPISSVPVLWHHATANGRTRVPVCCSLLAGHREITAEARRLLKEAEAEALSFELLNRNVDQPFKYVATWLIDEWSKIGLHVTQRMVPDGPPGSTQCDRQQQPTRRADL